MPYGTIKVDNITFTNGGSDTTITVSGLAASTTGNLTVTGTISGAVVRATTVSGVTVTGTTVQGASGTFTSITGGIATITSGVFALGSAAAPSISFSSDPNTGIYSPGADQVAISTNGSGRLFVDASGNVSVGSSTAAGGGGVGLSLYNSSVPILTFRNSTTGDTGSDGTHFYASGSDFEINNKEAGYLGLRTSNLERLRITSAGLVGIGTSSPGSILHLQQSASAAVGPDLRLTNNAGTASDKARISFFAGSISPSIRAAYDFNVHSSGVGEFIWSNGEGSLTERMRLDPSGRLGIGTSAPATELQVVGRTLLSSASTYAASTAAISVYNGSASANYYKADNHYFQLASGTGVLTTDSSGRVGIGTTSPSTLLHLASSSVDPTISLSRDPGSGNVNLIKSDFNDLTFTSYRHLLFTSGGTTERARIDSSGRLLVGTSSVTATGSVFIQGNSGVSTGAGYLNLQRGQAAGASIGAGSLLGLIQFTDSSSNPFAQIYAEGDAASGTNDYPGRLVFSTTADGASSPTERMRINNAGTSTFTRNTTGDYVVIVDNTANTTADNGLQVLFGANAIANTSYFIICAQKGVATRFQVLGTGNVQNTNNSYAGISDAKLKENIVDANSQWDDIKAIQVRNYNFKEGQTHKQIGLIAQEVEQVSPGLVLETPDRDEDNNDLGTVTKSVQYSILYMKAVKALQEAMERIETLEASNADLLARVSALESKP